VADLSPKTYVRSQQNLQGSADGPICRAQSQQPVWLLLKRAIGKPTR